MIDATVPERGQQPRDLVLEVLTDTFDAAMDLATPAAELPQLQPSIELARAAQARDDVFELDRQLCRVAVAAIATRVRLRCNDVPEEPPAA